MATAADSKGKRQEEGAAASSGGNGKGKAGKAAGRLLGASPAWDDSPAQQPDFN